MQIKTTMKYHLTLVRMAINKSASNNAGESIEKSQPYYIVGGMWNGTTSMENYEIAGRNINNFRYADDTTLMAETEEELKNLLMKEESEKVGLKLNI